jgi:hypothetical protein
MAVSLMTYGTIDVAFLDDHVYPERDGFWVRGEQRASMVVRPRATGSVTIHLRNGAAANAVEVDTGSVHRVERLAPRQESDIAVPVPPGTESLRMSITSPSGFRPIDVQEGTDARELGVWVALKP